MLTVAACDVPGALGHVLASISSASERAYVHVDLDVLDPREGCANPFAVRDGVTLDSLLEGIAAAGRALRIEAAALTAYDPCIDTRGEVRAAAMRIAQALVAVAAARSIGRPFRSQ